MLLCLGRQGIDSKVIEFIGINTRNKSSRCSVLTTIRPNYLYFILYMLQLFLKAKMKMKKVTCFDLLESGYLLQMENETLKDKLSHANNNFL